MVTEVVPARVRRGRDESAEVVVPNYRRLVGTQATEEDGGLGNLVGSGLEDAVEQAPAALAVQRLLVPIQFVQLASVERVELKKTAPAPVGPGFPIADPSVNIASVPGGN